MMRNGYKLYRLGHWVKWKSAALLKHQEDFFPVLCRDGPDGIEGVTGGESFRIEGKKTTGRMTGNDVEGDGNQFGGCRCYAGIGAGPGSGINQIGAIVKIMACFLPIPQEPGGRRGGFVAGWVREGLGKSL
jgi:hypothetical protein